VRGRKLGFEPPLDSSTEPQYKRDRRDFIRRRHSKCRIGRDRAWFATETSHGTTGAFRVTTSRHQESARRKQRLQSRMRPRRWSAQPTPTYTESNMHYDLSTRTRGMDAGSIGAMLRVPRHSGLVVAAVDDLENRRCRCSGPYGPLEVYIPVCRGPKVPLGLAEGEVQHLMGVGHDAASRRGVMRIMRHTWTVRSVVSFGVPFLRPR